MPKAVWSVGGFWSLSSTGTLVKRGIGFTAIKRSLLFLWCSRFQLKDQGPWWRQGQYLSTPEIASFVFRSLSLTMRDKGPHTGQTFYLSGRIITFLRLSRKSGAWPHSLWQAACFIVTNITEYPSCNPFESHWQTKLAR